MRTDHSVLVRTFEPRMMAQPVEEEKQGEVDLAKQQEAKVKTSSEEGTKRRICAVGESYFRTKSLPPTQDTRKGTSPVGAGTSGRGEIRCDERSSPTSSSNEEDVQRNRYLLLRRAMMYVKKDTKNTLEGGHLYNIFDDEDDDYMFS
eukprot:CAMPEP_0113580580 /NCGR_PEP_ID=MMETSP0015_2-20120614/30768_1 /TAXON_ID=2838 /ORGANISM="Odontella" /LENGTH=146 /DNA_ID=CAMNT_0000484817 /DNA_START=165 /DNA_END=605 /DNA_ORIENTATION=- /assembly_acc=CAM_ASM_000160